eukprot:TRINITY_DN19796_c0_g1_i1.p1 TRINITY_DN19796_c0_g1~~TRINITY_DN19796_c0_g1_i1.p1  ORF type:complete len:315 (+),score=65.31 TRINITY_DN19796_c0_g1_i1:99-947(+)
MKGYASAGKKGGPVVPGGKRSGPYTKGTPRKVKGVPAAADEGDEKDARTVYVSNLAFSTEWQELKDFMSQAGEVEFAQILSIDGSRVATRGNSRGVGYVRFTTEQEASSAIETLNGAEMDGREILVDVWTSSGRKEGGTPRPASTGKSIVKGKSVAKGRSIVKGKSKGGWSSGSCGKNGVSAAQAREAKMAVRGEANTFVWVGGLPFKATWQQVKDLMKTIGDVEFVKMLFFRDSGRPRGTALVRFSTEEEALEAISTLSGTEFMGKEITVDTWTDPVEEDK